MRQVLELHLRFQRKIQPSITTIATTSHTGNQTHYLTNSSITRIMPTIVIISTINFIYLIMVIILMVYICNNKVTTISICSNNSPNLMYPCSSSNNRINSIKPSKIYRLYHNQCTCISSKWCKSLNLFTNITILKWCTIQINRCTFNLMVW